MAVDVFPEKERGLLERSVQKVGGMLHVFSLES